MLTPRSLAPFFNRPGRGNKAPRRLHPARGFCVPARIPRAHALQIATMTEAPEHFTERHFALLDAHKIERHRLLFFANHDELCRIAREKGVDEKKIEGYRPGTLGLRIQEDDHDPGGPNVWILVHASPPPESWGDTAKRIAGWGLKCPKVISDPKNPAGLLAFVLLHEIAHHHFSDGEPRSEAEEDLMELRADEWALEKFRKHGRAWL